MDLLQQEYLWGVQLWRLILAGVILVVELLSRGFVKWLVRKIVAGRRSIESEWASDAVSLLPRPLSLVLHVAAWFVAGQLLHLPEEPTNVRAIVMGGLLIAVTIAMTGVIFRIIDVFGLAAKRKAAATATRLDDQLVPLLGNLLKALLAIAVAIALMDKMGYSVTSFIASLGIGGLALALAAKDTVGNLFGSIALFTDQPFVIGDVVKVDGIEGVVEEIGLRVTRIRQADKVLATIPNQTFTTSTVINYSKRPQRRIRHKVGLSYDTSPDQMEAFVGAAREMMKEMDGLDESSIVVWFESMGDSSLGVIVQAFSVAPGFDDFMEAQEVLLLAILRLAEEHGLEIAFPSRTIYLESGSPKT